MRFERTVDVLFQGDSITDSGRWREDPYHLGSGYPNVIAGRLGVQLAEQKLLFLNRGISGHRVSDLYARWNEDAIYLQPKRISILIGVNDAWRIMNRLPEGAADRFESAYRHLLDITKQYMPDTGIILCEPFILNCGATVERWSDWEQLLQHYQSVVRQLSVEYDTLFVPFQQALTDACNRQEAAHWLSDGVHPTPAGHELLAQAWLTAVNNSKLAIS